MFDALRRSREANGPSPIKSTPRIPHSLKRQAEEVVVQAAREFVQSELHPDHRTATEAGDKRNALFTAVRVLDQLKG